MTMLSPLFGAFILLLAPACKVEAVTDKELYALQKQVDSMGKQMSSLLTQGAQYKLVTQTQNELIQRLETTISNQQTTITYLQEKVEQYGNAILDNQQKIDEQSSVLTKLDATVVFQNNIIKTLTNRIASLDRRCRLPTFPMMPQTSTHKSMPKNDQLPVERKQQHTALKNETYLEGNEPHENQMSYQMQRTNGKMEERNRRLVLNNEGPIAFMASLSHEIDNIGIDQNIHFDTVQLNIGNGYHAQHGLFIAPQSGIYIFCATLLFENTANLHAYAALVHDNKEVAVLFTRGDGGSWDSGSQTAIVQVTKGDEIWVRNKNFINTAVFGINSSTFGGYLLWPM